MAELLLLPFAATIETVEVLEGVTGHVEAGDIINSKDEDHGVGVVGGQSVLYGHLVGRMIDETKFHFLSV